MWKLCSGYRNRNKCFITQLTLDLDHDKYCNQLNNMLK